MIDIGTVLNKISDTVDERSNETKVFGLKFLTAEGLIREMQCRKSVKMPKAGLKEEGATRKGKMNYNLKVNGVLLLQDLEAQAPRSVKASCILQFKDFKTQHWEDVRH